MKFFLSTFAHNVFLQIFEMMDAKARQDCIKEIDLLKVKSVKANYTLIDNK